MEQNGNVVAKFIDRQVAKVYTVQLDPPGFGIVEPAEEFDKRALTGTVGPNNSSHLARWNRHVKVSKSDTPGAGSGFGGSTTVGWNARNSNRFPRKRLF
jgi:hypothetical protein